MLGLKEASKDREKGEYIGMYRENDIPTERRRLQHTIDNNVPTGECSYHRYTGTVFCGSGCICSACLPGLDEVGECPVEVRLAASRNLSLLATRFLMRHVFSNPVLAASNDCLEKENLIYSH